MEQETSTQFLVAVARILAKEKGAPETDLDAFFGEAQRLIRDDPDFAYLNKAWLETPRFQFHPGVASDSLDELRAEAARLKIARQYPGHWLRFNLLTSTTVMTVLWVVLSGALDSATLENQSLGLQIPIVGVAAGVGIFLAWGLITRRSREIWLEIIKPEASPKTWPGLYSLAVLTLLILAFATLSFAGVTELLYLHGVATTSPDEALDEPLWDSALFYIWSFLNAIPVLEIPQTLSWQLDFRFTDRVNPVLLLLYKLAVIGPVIATGKLAWEARRLSRS